MYTILVNDDNTLLATVKERIMQRSKLVDNLHFIVNKKYKELDMEEFNVLLEYLLPVSKEYHTEMLVLSNNNYTDTDKETDMKLEYILPFDTKLTKEAGKIEVQLTFLKTDLDVDGNGIQQVRKTSPCTITIVPISAWSDMITDNALNVLDQKLLAADARMKELEEIAFEFDNTKADNIVLDDETHEVYLTANGNQIGDKISMSVIEDSIIANSEEGLIEIIT